MVSWNPLAKHNIENVQLYSKWNVAQYNTPHHQAHPSIVYGTVQNWKCITVYLSKTHPSIVCGTSDTSCWPTWAIKTRWHASSSRLQKITPGCFLLVLSPGYFTQIPEQFYKKKITNHKIRSGPFPFQVELRCCAVSLVQVQGCTIVGVGGGRSSM